MKENSIWKNKIFMRLFTAYTIATMGSFFDMMAVILLFSYIWHVEPWVISLVPVAYALPHALFSQFVGILADKYNKIYIMLIADIITVFFTVLLIFAASPWLALFILLFRATVSIVHFPAQQAIIRKVVDEDHILKAVTLNGAVNQFSKIIGPFLGVAIATAFSPKVSFVVYIIALLLSIGILFTLRHVDKQEGARVDVAIEKRSFWKMWREGWQDLFHSTVLFVSFLFVLIAFTALQLVDIQFTVLFRELYPSNPAVFGWALSSIGAGAIISMISLNRLQSIKKYGLLLGSSVLFVGIGVIFISFLEKGSSLIWPIVFSLLIGVGVGLYSGVHGYILQKESPEGKVGQMSGLYNSLSGIILLVAPVLGGILVQNFGVFSIFQIVGGILVVIALIGIIFQKKLWHGKKSGGVFKAGEVDA